MVTREHPDSGARNPALGIYLAAAGKISPGDFVQELAPLPDEDSGGLPFWILGKPVEPARKLAILGLLTVKAALRSRRS
jgi:hypothetical protein